MRAVLSRPSSAKFRFLADGRSLVAFRSIGPYNIAVQMGSLEALIVAIAYNRRTHFCGQLRAADVGNNVLLVGWVNNYRDHGGMVFIDIRDYTGITQIKFNPQTDPAAHEVARHLRMEDVIAVRGDVISRGENVNPKIPTGEIEVNGREVELLSKADPVPFEIAPSEDKKREVANEDLRLRYRFLDLRRPEVQQVFRLRHRVAKAIRDYFDAHGFVEIETPFLTKSTPEGARDYLVPSRVHPGSLYAFPHRGLRAVDKRPAR